MLPAPAHQRIARDTPDVGAEVGQQRARERRRGQTGELDDLQPGQWSRRQSVREMTSRMISLVPPKMREMRRSVHARAIGYSVM